MVNYNQRLVEVDVILNRLPQEDYNKIPKEIIQVIKENKDQEYIWNYDETKSLKDQNLSRDTIAFLSYINMEYLLNEKQKAYMENMHEINEQKMRKQEYSNENKYDYSDLFKKNNQTEKQEEKQETALIEYKESLFTKIINKIKKFFNKEI